MLVHRAVFAPKGKDRTMHQHYRKFAESAAAKGEAPVTIENGKVPYRVRRYDPKTPTARIGKVIRRVGRLVPGTSW